MVTVTFSFIPTFALPFRSKTPRVEALYSLRTGSVMQQLLSRVWFLNQGCKQVPLEYTKNIVRWAHPDGYFLNAQGHKMAHTFSPSSQRGRERKGSCYPADRALGGKTCHLLMALAFYGPRPTFENTSLPLQGKGQKRGSYVGICHHLIPDALDYKPANLLCWLTRAEHTEADRRQRALRAVLPDMHAISYEKHRFLQDPRTTCREVFDVELQKLRQQFK